MARHPLFLGDDAVTDALDQAAAAAVRCLAQLLPELDTIEGAAFRERLLAHLSAMLAGRSGAEGTTPLLPRLIHGDDAFGDPFSLEQLPLPRAGTGYAVQKLDTDTLLDQGRRIFLPVRDPSLQGLFDSFDAARSAARDWLRKQGATVDRCPLAIVPAYRDEQLQRHVLIYGVLTRQP